jgi:hypothetical protein
MRLNGSFYTAETAEECGAEKLHAEAVDKYFTADLSGY